jgi:hypothetical protein
MTFNQLIKLLPKVVKYNLKIIFAGKFFWFLLAAFGFFAFFMFQTGGEKKYTIFDKNPFPYHRMKIIRHTEGIQQNIPK